ncbi:TetR/AcrR family transcriptional regulator [Nocardioides sp.]|uniref:TetR/AcrR family transcriptional regulator n=1 Tax=Nocardioides sp. TaxID=35761 RepID=UPI002B26BB25|nr:TetR family transcriptional regulator [Nocardioides sp.]
MIKSATDRRVLTADRIMLCAQTLTDEAGLDGFTMDDLATAAEVSRRTLFNYFPSKIDAVLGVFPILDPDDVDTFCSGGPDRDLVQDLRTLVLPLLRTDALDRDVLARGRRIMLANPRLVARVHEGYVDLSAQIVQHIITREGPAFAAQRARVAVGVLAALFDAALDEYLVDPDERPIAFHFDESLRTARSLLGA